MTPGAALPVSPLDPAEAEGRRRRLLALAVVSAVAATVLQMRWLEATKAAVASVEGASRHAVSTVTLFRAALSSMDFVSGLAAAAIVFSLAEAVRLALGAVRVGGSAGLSSLVPRGAFSRALLLLALAFTYLRWHLAPGFVAGFDVDLHASTVALAAKEISEGRYPAWTDAWYLGFPLLRYYGAAYYLPAAALAAATGDVRLGVKVVALLWHLGAVPAAYALAKETGASHGVAMVSAVAYAACSFFGATLAATGSLTAAPVIALVPAALALAVRTGSPRGEWKHAAGLGLAIGLLLAAHPAYAVPAGALCAVAFFASAWPSEISLRLIGRGFLAVAIAVLAALPVLHAWIDVPPDPSPRVAAHDIPTPADLLTPEPPRGPVIASLFVWTPTPRAGTGYLGVVYAVLAAIGLGWRLGGRRCWLFFGLSALVFAWGGGGFVHQRTLLLLPATLLPLLAAGIGILATRKPRVAVLAVALLAVELGLGSLWSPYRSDLAPFGSALAEESARQGAGRTVLLSCPSGGPCTAGEWQVGYESPLRTTCGGFPEVAPDTYDWMPSFLGDPVAKDPDLSDARVVAVLRSWGVTSVRRLAARSVLPRDEAVEARLRPAPVVLLATHLGSTLTWSADRFEPRAIVAEMAPDFDRGLADFAWVHAPAPLSPAPDWKPEGELRVLEDLREGPKRTLRLSVPHPGWLRLSLAWVPGMKASLSGRNPDCLKDVLGCVVVPVEKAGEATLVLEVPTSTRFLWGPIAAVAIVGALAFRERRRRA